MFVKELRTTNSQDDSPEAEIVRPAIYAASWHDCFGSLHVIRYPLNESQQVIGVAQDKYCLPYIEQHQVTHSGAVDSCVPPTIQGTCLCLQNSDSDHTM